MKVSVQHLELDRLIDHLLMGQMWPTAPNSDEIRISSDQGPLVQVSIPEKQEGIGR